MLYGFFVGFIINGSLFFRVSDERERERERMNLRCKLCFFNKLIPNNWIRLLGAGSGGYFLISPKIDKFETSKILGDSKFNNYVKADMSLSGVSVKSF